MSRPIHTPAAQAAAEPAAVPAQPPAEQLGTDTLYAIINAVAQGPELGRVLPAVVDLLTEATACHACFVYLLDGERLWMRAASAKYAASIGRVSMDRSEGLCGWVVRNDEPVFIRDGALSDPRMKIVEELEEERFQSMVAVPLRGREGRVIGVIVLHTQAPREFGQEVRDFLVHVASLVAGAIEGARTFEQERARARLLDRLAVLVQEMAAATDRAELWELAADGTRELLGAARCRLALVVGDDGAQRIVARAGEPGDDDAPPVDAPERGAMVGRLLAGELHLGVLAVERTEPFTQLERDLLGTVAGHLAVALRTLDLISRLAEENLVRDLFDAIAAGRADRVAGRARAARLDPDRPYVIAVVEPVDHSGAWEGGPAAEERLRRALPGALCDLGTERLRVLLPVGRGTASARDELPRLDAALTTVARTDRLAVGRSAVQPRLTADPAALTEAEGAARIARSLEPDGGLRAWEGLGVYRYLARAADGPAPDARHGAAVAALWAYDARRGSELIPTLERYLADRRIVPTARALFIHPNTLRQRLERIESITGLRVGDEDPLSLELAIKLHRLSRPSA